MAKSGFAVLVTGEEKHCRIPEGNAHGRRKKNLLFQVCLHFRSSDLSETNAYSKQNPYKALQKAS